MCGENYKGVTFQLRDSGSPPRVRGKPLWVIIAVLLVGITPACAGKTLPHHVTYYAIKDHPRVCGENKSISFANKALKGSPPRVRGKPDNNLTFSNNLRITPACAGKTFANSFGFSYG